MSKCNHENIKFIGFQETMDPNNQLFLFNCSECHTTLSINKKQILSILDLLLKSCTISEGANHAYRKSHKR